MVSQEKKNEYWNYFTSQEFKKFRTTGMTDKRLEKVKRYAFAYEYLWDDAVQRHGGEEKTPEQMREDDFVFSHAIGNFFGILSEVMFRAGIIKHF